MKLMNDVQPMFVIIMGSFIMSHPICFVPSSQSQSITISKSEKSHISFSLLYETFGGISIVEIKDGIKTLFNSRIFATCVGLSICKDFIWSSMHKCQ